MRKTLLAAFSLVTGVGTLALMGETPALATTNSQSTLLQLTNLATIQTSIDGPADAQFQAVESPFTAPLSGTQTWHRFLRQAGRDITITLPRNYTLHTISLQMKQDPGYGVYYPQHVDFEVGAGSQWYLLGTKYSMIPSTDKRITTQTFSINAHDISASSIRIHFPVSVWVYVRNLQITGTTAPATGSPLTLPKEPKPYSQPLLNTDPRAEGIKNMLLVYTGANGSDGTWTEADFLPMVAYTPQNGAPSGRMFDTMLFGPYATMPDTKAGWQAYLTDLFQSGRELSALNEAVARQNIALGTPNFKEKVVFTLPYPKYGDGQWGSLNGQNIDFSGSTADPNALQARDAALDWYVKTLMSNWNNAKLQNLQLTGFYWNNEQISYTSPGEVGLVAHAKALADKYQQPLFWIPFYDAAGISDWQRTGFKAAWLQPNYIEQGAYAKSSRITNAEIYARQHGLGIELEVTGQALSNSSYQQLWSDELTQLQQGNFGGNVSHAYYAGSKIFVKAAQSTDPSVRALYDETYQFMHQSQ